MKETSKKRKRWAKIETYFKTENTFFDFPAVFNVLYGSLKSPRACISINCTIKSMGQTSSVRGKMG